MVNQKQSVVMCFSTDPETGARIEKQAKRAGYSVSKFIREIVLAVINDTEDEDE
jgi:predicted DNA-binding protein